MKKFCEQRDSDKNKKIIVGMKRQLLEQRPGRVHFIAKLNTTCDKTKYIFYIKHHQNESKFYGFFFMSRYTW